MDYSKLAELLFPNILRTPDDYEKMYPQRKLSDGEEVTRFAPSPTGFLHVGNVYAALIGMQCARQSKGIFFLRIEDTDKKREVENAAKELPANLAAFGIEFDEGYTADGVGKGEYGPYLQSERKDIYQAYAKWLVELGKAYPCFCSAEELEEMREHQEDNKLEIGYYGKFAKWRDASLEQIEEAIGMGLAWVLRLKSNGSVENRMQANDLVRGQRDVPENQNDVIILKSDGIPPYNFAHAVDDHLMRTTLVVRGDEWLPSLPEHLQIFQALGFESPKYAHISPLLKLDGENKRKLSKRKDPEARADFFLDKGYPIESIHDYLMNIANSDFEGWRALNPKASIDKFDFKLDKVNPSGSMFDVVKLDDVSKNAISTFSATEVFKRIATWAAKYQSGFCATIGCDALGEIADKAKADYAVAVLNIDREKEKPRKDIAYWAQVRDVFSYMFSELHEYESVTFSEKFAAEDVSAVLKAYPSIYNVKDDQAQWFDRIKALAEKIGFAREVKEFKQNPGTYRGHCGDVSTIIRVALTGRENTPDLYQICKLLGVDEIKKRFELVLENLNK